MHHSELVENFETGLYEAKTGEKYIKCEFNPSNPVWVLITDDVWQGSYSGRPVKLIWKSIDLPVEVKKCFKQIIMERMKKLAPSYLTRVDTTLKHLASAIELCEIDLARQFNDIDASKIFELWNCLATDHRSIFRSLFQELARKGLCGIRYEIAIEMDTWNVGRDTKSLRHVVNWNSNTGSLTSAELELVRSVLYKDYKNESDNDLTIRVLCLVLLETLKRPKQALSMSKDALWVVSSDKEFFLRIPRGKYQTGGEAMPWQITSELAHLIMEYSSRPKIKELQHRFDRLIVFTSLYDIEPRWMKHGQVDITTAKSRLQCWINSQKIISPRTSQKIKLAPYRLRHTGATSMALQGVSRDDIQEVLEHDSPYSADSYIEAVGSDLMPALERAADRGLGDLFSEFTEAFFFKGDLKENIESKKIYIPIVTENVTSPALIGGCNSGDGCNKHPLWACYSCPNFLAWKDGNHHKSLEYIETELKRWDEAEGGKERSKLGKDFERVGAAIREVINQINRTQI